MPEIEDRSSEVDQILERKRKQAESYEERADKLKSNARESRKTKKAFAGAVTGLGIGAVVMVCLLFIPGVNIAAGLAVFIGLAAAALPLAYSAYQAYNARQDINERNGYREQAKQLRKDVDAKSVAQDLQLYARGDVVERAALETVATTEELDTLTKFTRKLGEQERFSATKKRGEITRAFNKDIHEEECGIRLDEAKHTRSEAQAKRKEGSIEAVTRERDAAHVEVAGLRDRISELNEHMRRLDTENARLGSFVREYRGRLAEAEAGYGHGRAPGYGVGMGMGAPGYGVDMGMDSRGGSVPRSGGGRH